MSSSRTLCSVVLALIGAVAWGSSADLRLSVVPVFVGSQKNTGVTPIHVSISNAGPDAMGEVQVKVQGYQMDYPVELPESSSKDLIVYAPSGPTMFETSVELNTNRGSVEKAVDPAGMDAASGDFFLEIGGNPGDLSFLDSADKGSAQITSFSAYVSPEVAPDRLAAYLGCNMIVLGSGAERMSDGAVRALKLYVLRGGLLVFPGGTASLLLSDGRWQGLFPVEPKQPRLEESDSLLRSIAAIHNDKKTIAAAHIGQPYSVIDFDPLPGVSVAKQGALNLMAAKSYGFGKVVFWGFNPFTGSVRDWPGLAQFFKRTAHFALPGERAVMQSNFENEAPPEYSGYRPPGSSSTSTPLSFDAGQSPFQVTMPSAGHIGSILGIYFLCVVPINFFILSRFKKRQLGWSTAALTSIAFGGVMLSQAKELYNLPTSHSDKIFVVAEQGLPVAVASGSTQLFASSGGVYDLKMRGVDQMAGANQTQFYNERQAGIEMFAPVDVGSVQIDAAQFKNLGFGQFSFEQLIDADHLASVEKTREGYSVSSLTPLKDAMLVTANGSKYIGNLSAGQTVSIKRPEKGAKAGSAPLQEHADVVIGWLKNGETALIASAPDLAVGPQFGKRLAPDPVLIFFAGGFK